MLGGRETLTVRNVEVLDFYFRNLLMIAFRKATVFVEVVNGRPFES